MERTIKASASAVSPQPIFDNVIEPVGFTFTAFTVMKLEEQIPPPEDSELSIFDAQKYFNEPVIGDKKIDEVPPRISSSSIERKSFRAQLLHATPTASSEASWNSQTGLLTNQPGAFAVSIRNPPPVKEKKRGGKKWGFPRKCPCYGRKSIMVEESNAAALPLRKEAPPPATRFEESPPTRRFTNPAGANEFTFPILTQPPTHRKISLKGPIPVFKSRLQDPPRESLEVFQPPEDTMTVSSSKPATTAVAYPRTTAVDDDMASDASSDLFEIESFSTQSTFPTYNTSRGDPLDEAANFNVRRLSSTPVNGGHYYSRPSVDELRTPSVAATECYAPSEVSIDWSIVTAEGFTSITSFSVTALATNFQEILHLRDQAKTGGHDGGKFRLINTGGLLSCHCDEAVSVGPQPVRYTPEQRSTTPTSKHVNSKPSYKTELMDPRQIYKTT